MYTVYMYLISPVIFTKITIYWQCSLTNTFMYIHVRVYRILCLQVKIDWEAIRAKIEKEEEKVLQ